MTNRNVELMSFIAQKIFSYNPPVFGLVEGVRLKTVCYVTACHFHKASTYVYKRVTCK